MERLAVTRYSRGWNESRVRRLLDYHESQTDEEAATEIRSALENTTMEVPTALVPVVRELIAKRKSVRARTSKRRNQAPQPASPSRLNMGGIHWPDFNEDIGVTEPGE